MTEQQPIHQYDWSNEMPNDSAFKTGYWSFFNNKTSRFRFGTTRDNEFMRGFNAAYYKNIEVTARKERGGKFNWTAADDLLVAAKYDAEWVETTNTARGY